MVFSKTQVFDVTHLKIVTGFFQSPKITALLSQLNPGPATQPMGPKAKLKYELPVQKAGM
jgi:hypothetical protein